MSARPLAALAGAVVAAWALSQPAFAAPMEPVDRAAAALRARLVGHATLDGRPVRDVSPLQSCHMLVRTAGAPPVVLNWRTMGDVSQSGLVSRHGVGLYDGRRARTHVVQLPTARDADLAEASMTVIFEGCAAR